MGLHPSTLPTHWTAQIGSGGAGLRAIKSLLQSGLKELSRAESGGDRAADLLDLDAIDQLVDGLAVERTGAEMLS